MIRICFKNVDLPENIFNIRTFDDSLIRSNKNDAPNFAMLNTYEILT